MKYKNYKLYKNIELDWLEKIPEHWDIIKLSQGFNTIGSGIIPKSDSLEYYDDGLIPWVTTSELRENEIIDSKSKLTEKAFKDYPTLKVYPKGTILIAMYGATIGRMGILGINATVNQACCALSNATEINNLFAYYWLWMARPILLSYSLGGGQPNLNQNLIKMFKIACPPLTEQLSIAAFLDRETARIDALIEKKKKLIELLKEKRTALITRAVTKGLNKEVKMKPSGIEWLGEIPEHWEVKRLKYLFKNLDYKRIPISSEIRGGLEKNYPYYGASGIIDYVDNWIFNESLLLVAEDGANLYSRSTPLAFIANGKYWVNNHAHILKPNDGQIEFWGFVLALFDYEPLITGAAQPNLTGENLGEITLPKPPNDEIVSIKNFLVDKTNKIDFLSNKIIQAISKLQEYRTALISAAVTGKIWVGGDG